MQHTWEEWVLPYVWMSNVVRMNQFLFSRCKTTFKPSDSWKRAKRRVEQKNTSWHTYACIHTELVYSYVCHSYVCLDLFRTRVFICVPWLIQNLCIHTCAMNDSELVYSYVRHDLFRTCVFICVHDLFRTCVYMCVPWMHFMSHIWIHVRYHIIICIYTHIHAFIQNSCIHTCAMNVWYHISMRWVSYYRWVWYHISMRLISWRIWWDIGLVYPSQIFDSYTRVACFAMGLFDSFTRVPCLMGLIGLVYTGPIPHTSQIFDSYARVACLIWMKLIDKSYCYLRDVTHVYHSLIYTSVFDLSHVANDDMGWLRLVGSLKW